MVHGINNRTIVRFVSRGAGKYFEKQKSGIGAGFGAKMAEKRDIVLRVPSLVE
jgi:hypothetical protein